MLIKIKKKRYTHAPLHTRAHIYACTCEGLVFMGLYIFFRAKRYNVDNQRVKWYAFFC